MSCRASSIFPANTSDWTSLAHIPTANPDPLGALLPRSLRYSSTWIFLKPRPNRDFCCPTAVSVAVAMRPIPAVSISINSKPALRRRISSCSASTKNLWSPAASAMVTSVSRLAGSTIFALGVVITNIPSWASRDLTEARKSLGDKTCSSTSEARITSKVESSTKLLPS